MKYSIMILKLIRIVFKQNFEKNSISGQIMEHNQNVDTDFKALTKFKVVVSSNFRIYDLPNGD